ncbi:hypothetical protein [Sinorhizobium sp. CCBAU 05631]|uniref:hypothetical protein n=1 Tax=Sinorhizobium sp. CCBAU 05631 TaxID=794846 RepID=UPI001AEBC002|nr:hypothetical protein [Sinorhizobium sp. CCBAU 05631]
MRGLPAFRRLLRSLPTSRCFDGRGVDIDIRVTSAAGTIEQVAAKEEQGADDKQNQHYSHGPAAATTSIHNCWTSISHLTSPYSSRCGKTHRSDLGSTKNKDGKAVRYEPVDGFEITFK